MWQSLGANRMRARIVMMLPVALLLMAGANPAPPPAKSAPDGATAQPQALTAALLPGPAAEALVHLLLAPYAEATGTKLGVAPWDGTQDALKKLIDAHAADLVLLTGPQLEALCRAGTLAKLDWQKLGRDRFLPGAATDCGAAAYVSATVLAWDTDKLAGTPGWPDFWDVAKHPGRRGLHRAARGNLEIALLADGVAPSDVARTLRASDGVDRAFRKLDQLKPYIVWWDQPAQPAQLLATSKVLLTSAASSTLPSGPKSRVGVQWAGSLVEALSWAVPAGAPHPEAATAALGIATDPARLAMLARATRAGPPTAASLALLPADIRAQSPSLAAHLQAGVTTDNSFWAENGDRLETRFAIWAAK